MKNWITAIVCFWTLSANAQYYSDETISKEDFKPWIVNSPTDYSKKYHFGFSEGECPLTIIVSDTLCVAQITCYEWRADFGFVPTYRNLTDVRIEGNKFYSRETDGEFVVYNNGERTVTGLFVYEPWTSQFYEGGELGSMYPGSPKLSLPGRFSDASMKVLTRENLAGLNYKDLRLMRNEIFARYGYKFIEGGEMDLHFKSEKWYQPTYENVDKFLTIIERRNIQTILGIEKEKTAANSKK